MARGYAVFANGGLSASSPCLLERVEDDRGNTVYAAEPTRACMRCPERLAGRWRDRHRADLGALLGRSPPRRGRHHAPAPGGADAPLPPHGWRRA